MWHSKSTYTHLSIPVVSAATSAQPFCRGSFGIFCCLRESQSISVPVPNAYLTQETGGKNTFRQSSATLHHPYHCMPLEPVLSRSATDQVKTTRAMPRVHIRDKKLLMAGLIVGLLVNPSAFPSGPIANPILRRTNNSRPNL